MEAKQKEAKLTKKKYNSFPLAQLKKVPVGVQTILLDNNSIAEIPGQQFFELANASWKFSVQQFSISKNKLSVLPREISLLRQLKVLILDNNLLEHLPNDITKLVHLEDLSVAFNHLKDLPNDIGDLVNLRKLNCNNNKIARLPRSLAKPDKLTPNFQNNPVVYPPQIVFQRSWENIRCYLKDPLLYVRENLLEKAPSNPSSDTTYTRGSLLERIKDVKLLLSSPIGRESLRKFLSSEFCSENLAFWEAIECLFVVESSLQVEDFRTEALLVYFKYIDTESEGSEVNLAWNIRQSLCQLFKSITNKSRSEIRQELSIAQDHVLQLLALDCFPRYSVSSFYNSVRLQLPTRLQNLD